MATVTVARKRKSFYVWTAALMGCTVVVGFWFTYFEPLFQGVYPDVSPMVHVHGWTFFAWYALLIVQVGLVRSRQVRLHRSLGMGSIGVGAVMIIVGLIVSAVRVEDAVGPDGNPFWTLMGLPIFSIWILFTGFYLAAIYYRRRSADHKRYMLLASAAALSAATFRIVVKMFGLGTLTAIAGTLAPVLFVGAAVVYDYRSTGTVHRAYRWGLPAMLVLIGLAFILVLVPEGEFVQHGVAWIGRLLRPLY